MVNSEAHFVQMAVLDLTPGSLEWVLKSELSKKHNITQWKGPVKGTTDAQTLSISSFLCIIGDVEPFRFSALLH